MTLRGTLLVAGQEFRVRLRTGRWQWLLGVWVAVIASFTTLVWLDVLKSGTPVRYRGIPLFGALVLFLLTLVFLVAPALTAHSVNGDRERGTLATLQVTQLSAGDIAAGKLLSAWLALAGALALALPFVAWAVLAGGVGAGRAARTMAIIGVLAAALCAIAQGFSAAVDRTIASALLSYVVVFALTFGTLISFGLATGLSSGAAGQARPDRVWWVLAPNPYAIVADAAPATPGPQVAGPVALRPQIMVIGRGQCVVPGSAPCAGQQAHGAAGPAGVQVIRLPPGGPLYNEAAAPPGQDSAFDPLNAISTAVRAARTGPRGGTPGPVWPYGLAFDTLLGAGALWITIVRLRTPARALPPGARIA
jgi:ABC-type transport system involved in multi-copper enzyme maturation permease subunit